MTAGAWLAHILVLYNVTCSSAPLVRALHAGQLTAFQIAWATFVDCVLQM